MHCAARLALALFATAAISPSTLAASSGSPVEKVVQLLQDMEARIEQDHKVESQTYHKFACWCEKTANRKADNINAAQDDLRSLGQDILKLKGRIAVLTAEIAALELKIKENLAAQAEATSIRSKEHGAFEAASSEMMQELAALEKAIAVLRKGSGLGDSFLQQGAARAASAVSDVLEALPGRGRTAAKPDSLALLRQFVAAMGTSKYAPQSLTVQGILQDMYTTFSLDLEDANKAEAIAQRDFEDYIAQMSAELKADQKSKSRKEDDKSTAEQGLAESTQGYEDTEAQHKADVEFFGATKDACEAKSAEWNERSDLRAEELKGIEEALKILTSDENRALFSKTIKPGKETHVDESKDSGVDISFMQLGHGYTSLTPAAHAYAAVQAQAKRAHSLRLAALAVRIRNAKAGHFDAVIKSIDEMIQSLKDEGAADAKKRDQCVDEYQKVESTSADLKWRLEKNEAKIEKLLARIEQRESEKTRVVEQIVEVTQQVADLTSDREAENQAFRNEKSEDQQAIGVLLDAREALMSYYSNHSIEMGPLEGSVKGAALLEQGPEFAVSADQAPEAAFQDKGSRKHESKGIVQLLTSIIEDLEDEIKNGMKNEEKSQLDFEAQVKVARELNATLQGKKLNLEDRIAKRTQEKDDEEADKIANTDALADEKSYKERITPDCDWMINAFSGRAERRTAEMRGLEGAKEYLVGATAALAQTGASGAPARPLAEIRFAGLRAA